MAYDINFHKAYELRINRLLKSVCLPKNKLLKTDHDSSFENKDFAEMIAVGEKGSYTPYSYHLGWGSRKQDSM